MSVEGSIHEQKNWDKWQWHDRIKKWIGRCPDDQQCGDKVGVEMAPGVYVRKGELVLVNATNPPPFSVMDGYWMIFGQERALIEALNKRFAT